MTTPATHSDHHPAATPPPRPLLQRVLTSAWFPYLMLFLLQARVLWGIWDGKDVTFGDTAYHFLGAFRWYTEGRLDPVWSPIYSIFFGSFLYVTPDPARVVLLHRLVILLTAGPLVLAVLRRLLPAALAWCAAAWWVVLPINFNSLYEIHLFAVLPLLVAWLLLSVRARWARGAALGILLMSVLLLRNEMAPAVILLALVCLFLEWRAARVSPHSRVGHGLRLLVAYGLPLALVAGLCLFVLSRSITQPAQLAARFVKKNAFNVGQGFAVGYQQRHPEWTKNCWFDYRGLMKERFGKENVTLTEMIRLNPKAAFEHFRWNWRLTPAGLQVLLFNATSSRGNPDMVPVDNGRRWVLFPTILLLAVWVAGLTLLVMRWHFWWRAWLKRRAMLWIGMLAVTACAPIIISGMRPRPSFLLGLSVPLMAWTGTCLFILLRRFRRAGRWLPVLMVALIVLVPAYFASARQRPLLTLLRRTESFPKVFADPRPIVLPGPFGGEVRMYVGQNRTQPLNYDVFTKQWPRGVPLEQFLAERDVHAIYLDEEILGWLERERPEESRAFRSESPPGGWTLLGAGTTKGDRWLLLARAGP